MIKDDFSKVEESGLIVTSNDLILAKYNFTLWQKRVFNYFVSQIDKDAKDFVTQRVYIADLIKFYHAGDGREVYDIIQSVPKQLYETSIQIPYTTPEGYQRYGEVRIITKYTKPEDKEKGNAYIEFKFNDDLKPHLLELKRRFLKYDLLNIIDLQSTYSIRIFEILKSYEYIGEVKFEVDYLKAVMDLGEKYKLYADFKRYVIDKAWEDLRKYCDMYFDYHEYKTGRKVTALHFKILKNNNYELSTDKKDILIHHNRNELSELAVKLNEWWGVSKDEFLKRAANKSIEEIQVAIEFTKELVKQGKAKNPAGLLLDAISKGHKTQNQFKKEKVQKQEDKRTQLTLLIQEYETLKEQYVAEINEVVRKLTEKDPTITEKAVAKVKDSYERKGQGFQVKDKTIDDFRRNPMLRAAVIHAIQRENAKAFEALENYFIPKINDIKSAILAIEPKIKFE